MGRAVPLNTTVVPGTKPEPARVTVWVPPVNNCAGLALVTVGTGLTSVMVYDEVAAGMESMYAVTITVGLAGMTCGGVYSAQPLIGAPGERVPPPCSVQSLKTLGKLTRLVV